MFWNWLIESLRKIGTEGEPFFTLFEFVVTIIGIIQGRKFFKRIKEYIKEYIKNHRKRQKNIENIDDSTNTPAHEVKDDEKTVNLTGIFSSFFVTLTCIFVIFACSLYIKSYYSGSENKGKISISETDTPNNNSSETDGESEDKTDTESTTRGFWNFWRNTTKGSTATTNTLNDNTTQATDAKSTTDATKSSNVKTTSKTTSTTRADTSAEKIIKSGNCGNDMTYKIYDNGLLEINGSGEMYGNPWSNYRTQINKVIFYGNIKTIGYAAFSSFTNLSSITIPNSVIKIEDHAFYNSSIKSITIPNSVTSIGSAAFQQCFILSSVSISNSINKIDDYTFAYCTSLKKIMIPNTVTYIGSRAFIGCTNLNSISMSTSVSSIADYAFYNCSRLSKVYYHNPKDKWDNISIGSNNENLFNSEIIFS